MERKNCLAIVFDGAGVIYEPVRIVKDIERGEVKQSKLSAYTSQTRSAVHLSCFVQKFVS